ncbi:MAG: NAD-dependent epimerase/dehydratase family protein [Myxococcota bacterium]
MNGIDLAAAFAGKTALVTGGLGFIGSHVARRLVRLGARVRVIDALLPDCGGNPFNLEDVREQVEVRIADLREVEALDEVLAGCDHVFDLAGKVSHVDSMSRPLDDLEHNARAQLTLLEGCRRRAPRARVVLASTRQVYGRPRYLPLDEDHPCEARDVNGVHKLAAEQYHRVYAASYGIQSVVLRLTNTYGPGQLVKHARQGFIGWFVRLAAEGKTIEVMGDGEQMRDLNHVDDVATALLLAAASPSATGRTYNLGATPPISLRDLAKLLVELSEGASWQLVPFPPERARIDVGSAYASYAAIRRELGWEPRIALREGLAETLRFYRRHLDRYR